MECHKIINLLKTSTKQPSKFRTKTWVEVNDDSRGTYRINNQSKFKSLTLKSSLCDYSDAYILVNSIWQEGRIFLLPLSVIPQ